jgi:Xaa-Pro aminopeptidase
MDRADEIASKVASVRAYLSRRDADGLHLTRVENFAWITGGVRNYVTLNGVQTECSALVTAEQAYVVSPHSELGRLEPRLPQGAFDLVAHPWDRSPGGVVDDLMEGGRVVSDSEDGAAAYLRRQRVSLGENERARLAGLGRAAAATLEGALRRATPEMSEQRLGALIAHDLMAQAIEPVLVIVLGEAGGRSPHSVPGARRLGAVCTSIVCAKQAGLVVSLTRMIAFRGAGRARDSELLAQMRATTAIDAGIIDATRHSSTLAEAFEELTRLYAAHDHADGWRALHQGGIVGYRLKEAFASAQSTAPIADGMAFAWNITIGGTKSEDTYLLRNGKMHWVTRSPDSEVPVFTHRVGGETYERPGVLVVG